MMWDELWVFINHGPGGAGQGLMASTEGGLTNHAPGGAGGL